MVKMRKQAVLGFAWNHEIQNLFNFVCVYARENISPYFVIQEMCISFNMKCERLFLFSAKNDPGATLYLNHTLKCAMVMS